jgi:hypothetical protein
VIIFEFAKYCNGFFFFSWAESGRNLSGKTGKSMKKVAECRGKFVQKIKCFVQKIKKRLDIFRQTCGGVENNLPVPAGTCDFVGRKQELLYLCR